MMSDHTTILRRFEEHSFKYESNEKQIRTMIQATEDALVEMAELKANLEGNHKSFMENLEQVNANLIKDISEIRKKQNELLNMHSRLKNKTSDQKGSIDMLVSRMEKVEKKVEAIDQQVVDLTNSKQDRNDFLTNVSRID
mmetsp:Transcript_9429/g.14449  ORF Transcript_9429/g.14449 Transcript_9429/m.14449 type:complete len:140 (-) Transcript_9429:2263-2682(-)